jgi:hypothetical protein
MQATTQSSVAATTRSILFIAAKSRPFWVSIKSACICMQMLKWRFSETAYAYIKKKTAGYQVA